MMQMFFIGIGAGAATALLFGSVASGSMLSVLLFYLAPLPILIAALGWSHWAALIAAVFASTALAAIFGAYFFIAFLIGIGLPAWWLGYLALLARTSGNGSEAALEWYPVGHLVTWAAIVSAIVVTAAMLNFGTDEETFRNALRNGLERMFQLRNQTVPQTPAGIDMRRLIDFMVYALPPAAAVLTTITNIVNLWLAAQIVKISGRLRRPMPDLSAMRFPGYAPALTAAAVAGSFLPDLPGIAAGVLSASMLMAFAVLGFAVAHAITRRLNSRMFILSGIYVSVLVLGWPMLVMTLLGLADAAFDFRSRLGAGPPPATRT